MKLQSALSTIAILAFSSAALAAPGYLLVNEHSLSERDGAQAAELFLYDSSGEIVHSAQGGGQYPAGHYIELEEGWYFVEVGSYRAPANAVKLYVAAEHVTVVPTGWVSVRTEPMDSMPNVGCVPWIAQLDVFVSGEDGAQVLTASNQGTDVGTWGAIQLMAGEQLVYFNEVPAQFTVVENEVNELPTGYQGPVFGTRPQLALSPEDDGGLRLPLCEDGDLQVPVGTYWAAGGVAIDVYPYERRDWAEVQVSSDGEAESDELHADRLLYGRFEGEGSTPTALTEEERALIVGDGNGSGVRLNGFGR
ncbi:MAG: hypothetical protein ACJAYU_003274 [Bradymonadia bacterium]|jgi:hypothetical protein